MDLEELRKRAAKKAGIEHFPIDQCRRRVNALVAAGAFTGKKLPSEKNRWDYGEEAIDALSSVLLLEKGGITAKEAIQRVSPASSEQSGAKPAELEAEVERLREALRKQGAEIEKLQSKLRAGRRLPVVWSPARAFLSKLRRWFRVED